MSTLQEFKSWMQGVEDMQGPNWHPNKTQWARIREQIEQLEETVVSAPLQVYQPQIQYTPPPIGYRSSELGSMSDIPTYTNGDTPTFI